ncbi:MAG: hypothetical protein K8T89_08885 [Planctomycetes bacterium]|nr:hypothetical protein [Planctomycetota bacterium]
MRTLEIKIVSGRPTPVFEGDDKEAWVREALLSEAQSFHAEIMRSIINAENTSDHPVQFSGNEVCLDAFSKQSVVTAQWLTDRNGVEYAIEMPNAEIKQLLVQWQAICAEFGK